MDYIIDRIFCQSWRITLYGLYVFEKIQFWYVTQVRRLWWSIGSICHFM